MVPMFCLCASWYCNPPPPPPELLGLALASVQRDAEVPGLDAAREGHYSILGQGCC
jgi:hypothetical protein